MRERILIFLLSAILVVTASCGTVTVEESESVTSQDETTQSELTTLKTETSETTANVSLFETTETVNESVNETVPTPLPVVNPEEFWMYFEDEEETIYSGENYMEALGYSVVDGFSYFFFADGSSIKYDIDSDMFWYIPSKDSNEEEISYKNINSFTDDGAAFLQFDFVSSWRSVEAIENFIDAAESFRHYKDDNWEAPSGYDVLY